MIDARTLARLEVAPGVFFDEISTLKGCEEILNDLIASIPSIEAQIENAKADRATLDRSWLARANHALRVKRLCLPRLQELRARLARDEKAKKHTSLMDRQSSADRLILRVVKEIAPEVAAKAWDLARSRHPDAFEGLNGSAA